MRPATEAFDLTPTEVALLERAVPGEALVICAGERVFLDIVASPAEKQLFDTRPAEQAERNRKRRRGPVPQSLCQPCCGARRRSALARQRSASRTSSTIWKPIQIVRLRCQRGDNVHEQSDSRMAAHLVGRPVTKAEPTGRRHRSM